MSTWIVDHGQDAFVVLGYVLLAGWSLGLVWAFKIAISNTQDSLMQLEKVTAAFNAAINFALDCPSNYDGLAFLEMWREGDWEGIKKEFPDFDLSTTGQNYE